MLWGSASAFEGSAPVVLGITGAFAQPRGALFHLPRYLEPDAATVVGHLPGNHCPALDEATVDAFADAYACAVETAFGARDVLLCGVSIGGLVALALKAAPVRRRVIVEPPLVMSKAWPLTPVVRAHLAQARSADQTAFIANVFGVTASGEDERLYGRLLADASGPVLVLVGDEPLYPERATARMPSLVDEPERTLLAATPGVTLTVIPNAGHNVPQDNAPAFVGVLRAEVAAMAMADRPGTTGNPSPRKPA